MNGWTTISGDGSICCRNPPLVTSPCDLTPTCAVRCGSLPCCFWYQIKMVAKRHHIPSPSLSPPHHSYYISYSHNSVHRLNVQPREADKAKESSGIIEWLQIAGWFEERVADVDRHIQTDPSEDDPWSTEQLTSSHINTRQETPEPAKSSSKSSKRSW